MCRLAKKRSLQETADPSDNDTELELIKEMSCETAKMLHIGYT